MDKNWQFRSFLTGMTRLQRVFFFVFFNTPTTLQAICTIPWLGISIAYSDRIICNSLDSGFSQFQRKLITISDWLTNKIWRHKSDEASNELDRYLLLMSKKIWHYIPIFLLGISIFFPYENLLYLYWNLSNKKIRFILRSSRRRRTCCQNMRNNYQIFEVLR